MPLTFSHFVRNCRDRTVRELLIVYSSMATTTLLEYLTQPNPVLDCSKSPTGTNTVNARWDRVTGLKDWAEFNYETLMQSYGHVLLEQISPLPQTSPPLTQLDREIFTEKIFEDVLARAIMPNVSAALRIAWPLCYSTQDPEDIAEIKRGDHAKRGTLEEDSRYYPDWAGVRMCETTCFGYKNLCTGECKLGSKWKTSVQGQNRPDFFSPLNQIQTYCGRQWGVRHGYIITTEELVVVRVSRESVGSGLAASRPIREILQRASDQTLHSRTFSEETFSSELQAMSLDTGSSYNDDANPAIDYGPLLFKSIPWKAAGKRTLTVKLALWWLHMETKKDLSVRQDYPPLNDKSDYGQVQTSTGKAGTPPLPGPSQNTKRPKGKDKGSGKRVL